MTLVYTSMCTNSQFSYICTHMVNASGNHLTSSFSLPVSAYLMFFSCYFAVLVYNLVFVWCMHLVIFPLFFISSLVLSMGSKQFCYRQSMAHKFTSIDPWKELSKYLPDVDMDDHSWGYLQSKVKEKKKELHPDKGGDAKQVSFVVETSFLLVSLVSCIVAYNL